MNDTENRDLEPAAEAPVSAPINLTLDPESPPPAAPAAEPTAQEPATAEPVAEPAPAPIEAAPTIETAAPVEAAPTAEPAAHTEPETPSEPAPAPEAPKSPEAPTDPAPPTPAWEKPTPQLTLDPEPELPVIEFNTEPPHAPEPPAEPKPPVQNQSYSYNYSAYNTQNRPYAPPTAPGYQPPNYTAQSYRPRPQQQPIYTTPPMGYQQKSRLAAGLLAFTLGVFGVHNFYMGYNGRGTVQLLLSLLGGIVTCGLGTVATAVWAFIEAVMILSSTGPRFDGNGVIMKD